MENQQSEKLFNRACELIPGGVNSPVRAFKQVGANPIYIDRGEGAYIFDVDGRKYIDYVGSWGPLILGHSHKDIVKAIHDTALKGTSFGACSPLEVEMAELITSFFPSIEMVRMVNSGTEACMSAIRLARAFTGKKKIIKFEGCYHGHADSFLVKAGSGVLTLGIPGSLGVTENNISDTLIAQFNNIDSVSRLFKNYNDIAAIIVEPVMANAGLIIPFPNFLNQLKDIAHRNGALLIFDEVITGFRLAKGGAQEYFGIQADITCLGKIIGGGLPVGAFGGRKEIMELLAPVGSVYQAGTLSGNPLAMAAGIAMLKKLMAPDFYKDLSSKNDYLEKEILNIFIKRKKTYCFNKIGSLWTLFFKEGKVENYHDAMKSDTLLYASFFRKLMEEGVYLAPSQFEANFISAAHTLVNINITLQAIDKVLKADL